MLYNQDAENMLVFRYLIRRWHLNLGKNMFNVTLNSILTQSFTLFETVTVCAWTTTSLCNMKTRAWRQWLWGAHLWPRAIVRYCCRTNRRCQIDDPSSRAFSTIHVWAKFEQMFRGLTLTPCSTKKSHFYTNLFWTIFFPFCFHTVAIATRALHGTKFLEHCLEELHVINIFALFWQTWPSG